MTNRHFTDAAKTLALFSWSALAFLSACGGGGGGGGGGTTPLPPVSVTAHQIASGGAFNCRINATSGALSCWGMNDMGQLGVGNANASIASPTSVNLGSKTAKKVALGVDHACAILSDDSVSCWGNNSQGQLGQPLSTVSSASPVAVSGVTAKALALGFEHTCVLTLAGAVQCWGSNSKGQLGQAPTGLTQSPQPQIVAGLTGAKALSSGFNHLCVISSADTVQCWGDNQYGQLGNLSNVDASTPVLATGLNAVQVLSAGAYHSCAATTTAVSCWGRNDQAQLGSSAGTNLNLPSTTMSAISGVSQLAAGSSHTCALSTANSSSTVQCWGGNLNRQISGTGAGGVSAVTVSLINTPKNLSAGLNHSCLQDSANQTLCWGAGTSGRLGPNAQSDSAVAVVVP